MRHLWLHPLQARASKSWPYVLLRETRLGLGVVVLVLGVTAAAMPASHAAALPDPQRHVALSVVEQDIPEVLTEIGQQIGVRVAATPAVQGKVHGRLPSLPAASLLDQLAAIHGLTWYFDGAVLQVATLAETRAQVLALGPVPAAHLAQTLDALGIADTRWPLRRDDQDALVMAAGPPRYLELVNEALAALAKSGGAQAPVQVFHGAARGGA